MQNFHLDNRFIQALPGESTLSSTPRQVIGAFWSAVTPKPASAPKLIAHAAPVAELLDLTPDDLSSEAFLALFSGNRLQPGMTPYATCYGGHQFGHWAGQLGDGRAIMLAEVINRAGQRWELQLKGAGPTPYSRRADGLAVLRSSIREFLCSEAMHHLGIPTTRALSLITTGDGVLRDMFYDGNPAIEPGAVICRVSPSFIRFGHFELFTKRNQPEMTRQLVDFTLSRDFPEIAPEEPLENRRSLWFQSVCQRTAHLMVEWMRVGFVHGVMNTDNLSILGLTIDYGPYGWIDHFDSNWTPNTTDLPGRRYCFGQQPPIARWNLERLADALLPVIPEADLQAGLSHFDTVYLAKFKTMLAGKFGFEQFMPGDESLIEEGFALLEAAEVDMTDFFRRLADISIQNPELETLKPAFYRLELFDRYRTPFNQWLNTLQQRVSRENSDLFNQGRRERMNAINPRFILRNYLSQQIIDACEQGNHQPLQTVLSVLQTPYEFKSEQKNWYAIRPDWARNKAGCSMLSCSS
ncbi:MAG: YdiU family protein [Magnetococcales bacterium]|nr:YdiU family protein [Magnetococcales bacterium]